MEAKKIMEPVPLHHAVSAIGMKRLTWYYTDVDRTFWEEHLEGWVPGEIIDAHVHVVDPALRLVEPSEEYLRTFWTCEVCEPQPVESLERCYDICFPGRRVSAICFGHPFLDYDVDGMNAYTSRICAARGWHGLAVCSPDWDAEKAARVLDMPSIIGLKPYYAMIGKASSDRDGHISASIFDYLPHHQLEVLNERGGWLTLHVPKAERLGHPDNIREIREIRRRYPNVVLVIAHLGRSYTEPHAREGLPPLADDPEIFFDNSAVMNPAVHRLALEVIGHGRILYGTDNPVFYMRGRRQWKGRTYINRTSYPFYFNKEREPTEVEATYTLYMYEALKALKDACEEIGLGPAEVRVIFSGNAERLLRRVLKARPDPPHPGRTDVGVDFGA